MLMVCALSKGRLGLNGSSAGSCAVRGADLLALRWCLGRDARVGKAVLPCEEKCCSEALLSILKEGGFFAFHCGVCAEIPIGALVCIVQQDLYGSTGVESCCLQIEIRLNKGKR